METVEFVHTPSNVFELMQDRRLGRILAKDRLQVLSTAFKHGAYVAGGFARRVLRHGPEKIASFDEDVFDDLYSYLKLSDKIDLEVPKWNNIRGDIDVFFQDKTSLGAFLIAVKDMPDVKVNELESKAALEFICDKMCRIQVITKYVAPIEELLSSFDIYNAMVAFNDREAIIPKEWRFLEDERMLHVTNWTSPYVINRISKWFTRHGMHSITPKTAAELTENAMRVISELRREGPIEMPWGELSDTTVITKMKKLLPFLRNEDLILMMAYYPDTAYNGAFDILRKRGKM